ncbi:MAG: LysM peptidoglycan-binding domain-containing protein [Oligosphaeraceae bacterium]|mgnify:CR=1 FL=1|nr:LysM peptidoglycan-binding domain-containing protein [Oligosphaeraceae bacterium]
MKLCPSARCTRFFFMLLSAAGLALLSSCKTQTPVEQNTGVLGSRGMVPPPYARPVAVTSVPARMLPAREPVFPSATTSEFETDTAVAFVPAQDPAFTPSESIPEPEQVLLKPESKHVPGSDAAADTAKISTPVESAARHYRIQSGDTLSGIAQAYGVRWQDIAALNPSVDPKRMRVGSELILPSYAAENPGTIVRLSASTSGKKGAARKPKTVAVAGIPNDGLYTVVTGDSLWTISQRFKVSIDDIRSWNSLKTDKLVVGQKLKLKTTAASGTTTKSDRVSNEPKVPNTPVTEEPPPSVDALPVGTPEIDNATTQDNIVIPEEVGSANLIPKKILTHLAGDRDTLESLARDYEIKIEDILRSNPQIKSNADLTPGTEVKIIIDPNRP